MLPTTELTTDGNKRLNEKVKKLVEQTAAEKPIEEIILDLKQPTSTVW